MKQKHFLSRTTVFNIDNNMKYNIICTKSTY